MTVPVSPAVWRGTRARLRCPTRPEIPTAAQKKTREGATDADQTTRTGARYRSAHERKSSPKRHPQRAFTRWAEEGSLEWGRPHPGESAVRPAARRLSRGLCSRHRRWRPEGTEGSEGTEGTEGAEGRVSAWAPRKQTVAGSGSGP